MQKMYSKTITDTLKVVKPDHFDNTGDVYRTNWEDFGYRSVLIRLTSMLSELERDCTATMPHVCQKSMERLGIRRHTDTSKIFFKAMPQEETDQLCEKMPSPHPFSFPLFDEDWNDMTLSSMEDHAEHVQCWYECILQCFWGKDGYDETYWGDWVCFNG